MYRFFTVSAGSDGPKSDRGVRPYCPAASRARRSRTFKRRAAAQSGTRTPPRRTRPYPSRPSRARPPTVHAPSSSPASRRARPSRPPRGGAESRLVPCAAQLSRERAVRKTVVAMPVRARPATRESRSPPRPPRRDRVPTHPAASHPPTPPLPHESPARPTAAQMTRQDAAREANGRGALSDLTNAADVAARTRRGKADAVADETAKLLGPSKGPRADERHPAWKVRPNRSPRATIDPSPSRAPSSRRAFARARARAAPPPPAPPRVRREPSLPPDDR